MCLTLKSPISLQTLTPEVCAQTHMASFHSFGKNSHDLVSRWYERMMSDNFDRMLVSSVSFGKFCSLIKTRAFHSRSAGGTLQQVPGFSVKFAICHRKCALGDCVDESMFLARIGEYLLLCNIKSQ